MALDIPDIGEDLDLTLRQVTRQYPEHLARALLPAGTEVASVRWAETQGPRRLRSQHALGAGLPRGRGEGDRPRPVARANGHERWR